MSSPHFKDYETPELDDARRRGRYYQQLSYRYMREGENEKGAFAQAEADKWFDVFTVECDEAEGAGK
jgi:hypothetical protein